MRDHIHTQDMLTKISATDGRANDALVTHLRASHADELHKLQQHTHDFCDRADATMDTFAHLDCYSQTYLSDCHDAMTSAQFCTSPAVFRVELLTDDVRSDVCDTHLTHAVRAADVYDQAPIVSVIANHAHAHPQRGACGWELTDHAHDELCDRYPACPSWESAPLAGETCEIHHLPLHPCGQSAVCRACVAMQVASDRKSASVNDDSELARNFDRAFNPRAS